MRSRLLDPDGFYRRQHLKLAAWVALVCLSIAAIIAGLVYFFTVWSPVDVPKPRQISVPQLVGATTQQARAMLAKAGLHAGSQSSVHDAEHPAGTVLASSPGSGSLVVAGAAVSLTVSQGPVLRRVPDVAGLSADVAVRRVLAAHLQVSVTRAVPSARRRGVAVATVPAGGTVLPQDSAVVLQVGDGADLVPDVLGDSSTEAVRRLAAAGFAVWAVQRPDATRTPGTVLAVTPAVGTSIPLRSAVSITVAGTAPPTTAPPTTAPATTAQLRTASAAPTRSPTPPVTRLLSVTPSPTPTRPGSPSASTLSAQSNDEPGRSIGAGP